MPSIRFEATVVHVDGSTILRLPEKASRGLPSRGQVAVHGVIDGRAFDTVVEPDGEFGHWIKVEKPLQRSLKAGRQVKVELEPVEEWPEPKVPADLNAALKDAPANIQQLWKQITPMARWEWVRWVNATRNPGTRAKRVEVSLSKMKSGKRRPCCFNLASCTDPELSKNGVLNVDPEEP